MTWRLITGDARTALDALPAGAARVCVTSPPYWNQRDYGVDGQLGLEATPELYVDALVDVFRGVRHALADDGTVWLNIGDGYVDRANRRSDGESHRNDRADVLPPKVNSVGNGRKAKDMLGLPWMVAFALRADGWFLRSDVIWHKPTALPDAVSDRPTGAYEHVFLLSKRDRYFYDADAIREDPTARSVREGRPAANRRNVWTIPTVPSPVPHYATFPPKLVERCILAGSEPGDVVLDPFSGAGTTGVVALRNDRSYVGIDLSPTYTAFARSRILDDAPMFNPPLERHA